MDQQSSQINEPAANTSEQPKNKKNKKVIIITVAITLIVVSLIMAIALIKKSKDKESNFRQGDEFARQYLRNCQEREVSFTHSPVPFEQLAYIEPLGKMTDGHVTPTDHVYLNGNGPAESNDVVMPADGTVVQVAAMPAEYIGDRNQQTAPEDHRIVIAHNCRYVSIFIHVHKLSPELSAAVGKKLEPNTSKELNLELKAGAKIGKLGESVDWTLADAETTLSGFITPKLYERESWKIHTIDPLSVYSGLMKEELIAASLRTNEPFGGKIDYDKKGFLIGNWFKEGTNGYAGVNRDRYWDGHLSIVPDALDPTGTIFSIGNWQDKAAQFAVKTTLDPSEISKASGPTKFEVTSISYLLPNGQPWFGGKPQKGMKFNADSGIVQGTVLVQVMDNEKLQLEIFPGKTLDQVSDFTAAASIYTR